jgi:outer membrane lipoprotein SlyB
MHVQKAIFTTAIVALAVFGCASADTANPTTIDGLKGYTLRVVHPGEMLPMIYQAGRVNITVDKDNKITAVSFF